MTSRLLTARETEVLQALVENGGRTFGDVGHLLGLSTRTVETHVSSIHSRLGVSTTAAAAYWLGQQRPCGSCKTLRALQRVGVRFSPIRQVAQETP